MDFEDFWSLSMIVVVVCQERWCALAGNWTKMWWFCVGFDSGDRLVDRRRGVMRKVELMERSGSMMVVLANARLNPANDGSGWRGCFGYFPAIYG